MLLQERQASLGLSGTVQSEDSQSLLVKKASKAFGCCGSGR
jgi:hypothetical protein